MVYLEGFEPPISWSVAIRSIQLSHRYKILILGKKMETTIRFELMIRELQSHALPLGYVVSIGVDNGIRTHGL